MTQIRDIHQVAAELDLGPDDIIAYGHDKAKVRLHVLEKRQTRPDGRLVLVTAISPTPAGEGKTTVSIGLAQALWRLGIRSLAALREPSLGPVFGAKGGATGGGAARLHPAEEIDLHLTGDFHAITAANNLLCAMVDNQLHYGNALGLDPRRIWVKRALDVNDRALRHIVLGLGGPAFGVPREAAFQITAASEVMAIFCLAAGLDDLKVRLGRIVVGETVRQQPVTAAEVGAAGAMAALLRDAIQPNLVQTVEGSPVLVHGGPFANIAHGANSLLATRMGLKLADVVVTEAGFGSDLGAEKFVDIVSRVGELAPAAAVLVATVRALKYHGGQALDELDQEDLAALARGLANLRRHIGILRTLGFEPIVAVNRFASDTPAELASLTHACQALGITAQVVDVYTQGGAGAFDLARTLLQRLETPARPQPVYTLDQTLEEKITAVAQRIYGAKDVAFSPEARRSLRRFAAWGFADLPVCLAKTPYSFAHDPKLGGAAEGFTLEVREATLSAGAGFVVALTGDIITMPGLPKRPAALDIDVVGGRIVGLS